VPDDAALRRVEAYRYELPPELIARAPAEPADASRLLVVDDGPLRELPFADFPSLLRAGDVLAINETRVIRARLRGTREGGGAAEILLLRPSGGGAFDPAAPSWDALVRPGRRLQAGARVRFGDDAVAEVTGVLAGGVRRVRFEARVSFEEMLEHYGELPLPPYVGPGDAARSARYQTMFARVPGSVAAPTASLHFTPRVVAALQARGVEIVPLVLDVGLGTFRPMDGEMIDGHDMHAERYAISPETARTVNSAKAEGRRVVAAGTTVVRALEASARANGGRIAAGEAETDLFITPGFRFAVVDALLTNFHLPASTLLVLVAAFAGFERTLAAYHHAIAERFRFYSFGDAMFVERASGTAAGGLGKTVPRRE
jgi:S-adenosylmethionine:tRNA ribosyltransferase-isomerase